MASRTSTDYDFLIKVRLLGQRGVGTTPLLSRWADGAFSAEEQLGGGASLRADFRNVETQLSAYKLKLQVWDRLHNSEHGRISDKWNSMLYKGSGVNLFCYKQGDVDSLNACEEEIKTFLRLCPGRWTNPPPHVERMKISILLVGIDLTLSQEILDSGFRTKANGGSWTSWDDGPEPVGRDIHQEVEAQARALLTAYQMDDHISGVSPITGHNIPELEHLVVTRWSECCLSSSSPGGTRDGNAAPPAPRTGGVKLPCANLKFNGIQQRGTQEGNRKGWSTCYV